MRIVQLANFYSPTSGGLRTAVDTLGRGYRAAGHERVLVRPGRHRSETETDEGLVITLEGVPISGGYRMVMRPRSIRQALDRIRPDSVEVSDKATMVTAGDWARDHHRAAVLFSHERLDTWLAARVPQLRGGPGNRVLEPLVARWNRRLADRFDTVVVTSAFAEDEFRQLGVRNLRRVPLGVDLATFRPRPQYHDATARLVYAGRLSPEKNPGAVIGAVDVLVRNGNDVTLDVYGHGSALPALKRAAAGLPVKFHGHLNGRAELAARLAAADVAFAPSPAETFGLSILEALACGTPVVTADTGGAPELVSGGAGLAVLPTPDGLAGGVLRVLSRPVRSRRVAARRRAESYPWSATVGAMIDLHAMTVGAGKLR
jgi:alpha-1,6-mannosyltransferase